jgi:tetratricopeptide (TPR) repeat protein
MIGIRRSVPSASPMSRESLIFGIAGVFFGILVGWIIGSHHAGPARPASPPVAQQRAAAAPQASAAPLDESRATTLRQAAERDPRDVRSRMELANMYFDAERFDEAARWYQESLAIDTRNVNASTDLGISYYYMNQPDRALAQFERSLAIDPRHSKTLLNIGIVRAFGKDDLEGASKAWQRVIEVAPDTPEGKAARQALDGLRSAHPNLPGVAPPAGKPPGSP